MSAKAQLRFQLIRYRTITSDITSIVIGQLCLVDGHLQKLYARTKCITFYGENLPCVCNDCAWQRYWKVRSYECYIQSFKQIAPYTQLFHTPVAFCAPSNRLLLIRSLLLIFGAHVCKRQLIKKADRACNGCIVQSNKIILGSISQHALSFIYYRATGNRWCVPPQIYSGILVGVTLMYL